MVALGRFTRAALSTCRAQKQLPINGRTLRSKIAGAATCSLLILAETLTPNSTLAGEPHPPGQTDAMPSTAEVHWNARLGPAPLGMNGLASGTSGFVAVSQGTNLLFRSSDGTVWEAVRLAEAVKSSGAICFAKDQFVMGTLGQPPGLLASANGGDWHAVPAEGLSSKGYLSALGYEGGIYLASELGRVVFWSDDLANWHSSPLSEPAKYGFSHGADCWVVPTSHGAAASRDGKVWHIT